MLCTLGMAFTGQVLRWDEDAYWGLGIGAAIMGRVPFIGEGLVNLMLGGPIIASETLSRFFSLHVFIIPGTILALVAVHLRMVLTKGINEYPKPGHLVRRETYDKEYETIIKKEGIPFAPHGIWKDLAAAAITIGGILFCSAVFGSKGPTGPPYPADIDTLPRPDFFFMWIFAVAALMPEYMETFGLLVVPPVVILILFALPFFNNTGEKSWRRRPIAVLTVVLTYLVMGILTYLGYTSPWSPQMDAWSGAPTVASRVKGRAPLELQGLVVMQNMQCRNCHAIEGVGGHRGPDLADVGLPYDQGSTRSPSRSRRRQHAGLWEESFAVRGRSCRQLHGVVASGGRAACARFHLPGRPAKAGSAPQRTKSTAKVEPEFLAGSISLHICVPAVM